MEQNNNGLAPTIASFRLRWWTPRGAAYLAVRTGWRYFVTGREIRGNGDNATFWHDATRDHRGNPVEKLSRARWRRVARRWVVAGVPTVMAGIDGAAGVTSTGWQALGQTPPGWSQLPYGTALLAYVCVVAGVSATVAAPIVATWWRTRHIRSTYVYPAAAILAKVTGVRSFRFDRRFPNTLEVVIAAERPEDELGHAGIDIFGDAREDRVGVADRREAMRERDRRAPARELVERAVGVAQAGDLPHAVTQRLAHLRQLRARQAGEPVPGRIGIDLETYEPFTWRKRGERPEDQPSLLACSGTCKAGRSRQGGAGRHAQAKGGSTEGQEGSGRCFCSGLSLSPRPEPETRPPPGWRVSPF
mgnify:CR=1 FL=1